MLPGSKESGALRQSKVSVPPFCVDGLTTLVIPALNAAFEDEPPLLLLLPPPPLLPPQAASASAAAAPNAASPMVLRLLMR